MADINADTLQQFVQNGAQRVADPRKPGCIYSFVPAHAGSGAANLAGQLSRIQAEGLGSSVLLVNFAARGCSPWHLGKSLRRLDGHTWGALVSEVDGINVLEAGGVDPKQLRPVLEFARAKYSVVCANLTSARDSSTLEVLRESDGIFIVAGTGLKSLEGARDQVAWLRSLELAGRCGLLISHEPEGVNCGEAEDITGVPVCSMIDTQAQVEQLAVWLAAGSGCSTYSETLQLAIAV